MKNTYYTYLYLREDGTPYYVGKGTGRRAYNPSAHTIKPPKDRSRIVFPHTDLDEFESIYWEKFWIDFYGRKDLGTGILRNKTNGGDGVSGYKHTPDALEKMRDSMIGRVPWNKGIPSHNRGKSISKPSKIQCPHCNNYYNPGPSKLWHFDNCKQKCN
jgi:hypothetical protein